MTSRKLALLTVLAALVVAFFAFDLHRALSFEALKAQQAALLALVEARPLASFALFFAAYVAMAALSLPGAAAMTLLAGAIFGLGWGVLLVSFAASIGATLAFLASRYLFADAVRARVGDRLAAIDAGIQRDGAFYLFTLRLIPVVPFFVINLAMGLTRIRPLTFYGVSQIGMFPGTVVYVNAGTQIARLESPAGILSPGLIASFVAIALLPWIARFVVDAIRARRVYRGWPRPKRFDRNVIVIGAGSAGLVASYIAAAVRARVTLVERHRMGGDCLNTGCVPSKALLRTAKLIAQTRDSASFGLRRAEVEFDFADVMERVQRVVARVEPHDSVERYTRLGVDVVAGDARIVSPWEVEIATADGPRRLSARSIVVAAGARPFVPPIPGIADVGCLTSDDLWTLRELPQRLLVLGGGPIGCELALAFARLGARVTMVEMAPRLLVREDEDVSALIEERFRDEGIDLRLGHEAQRFERDGEVRRLHARHAGGVAAVEFDALLCAVGRRANVAGYGLEQLGVAITRSGTIEVNEYLQTRFPNVYACGDVAGPFQFTHTAAHMAWFATVNALFGRLRRFRVDWSVVPWCTFVDPEVARVGLNEQEARERGVAHEVTRFDIGELDRAIADGTARGFVKVLTVPGRDRVLGATIVGEHAGELIAEFVTAMKHGIGLNRILGTIHVYPTYAEANKYAAGQWKRAHAPRRVLGWLERYHRWQLGGAHATRTLPPVTGGEAEH